MKNDWAILDCVCGGTRFVKLYEIRWNQNQGTADKQIGLECVKCGKEADHAKLIDRKMVERKQAELEVLRAEIDSRTGSLDDKPEGQAEAVKLPRKSGTLSPS